jgi:aryl-alcohol dehydrogenase-like predicted oxidoreductase
VERRPFGKTGWRVSVIGFGAWGIGGPAVAGSTPIGWGSVDDGESSRALQRALNRGVNFIDTADVYGLGHSEELIGNTVGNRQDVIVATKVGHRLNPGGSISLDYSKDYIVTACEASLKRLRRERIDYYQLHSARVFHFEQGECFEALEHLKEQGKIERWGVSLNTFHPEPEADYLLQRSLGHGLQLVLNIINQRVVPLLQQASEGGYGIIVRMPLQFGLLTGKMTPHTVFEKNDHRSFRLTPAIMERALRHLDGVWRMAERYGVSNAALSLSFCASFPEVSTIIPGIKTTRQAEENTKDVVELSRNDRIALQELYNAELHTVVEMMERQG